MYAVIFRAKVTAADETYERTAYALRDLALQSFGCLEFVAMSDGADEMAISYWPDEASIRKWKAHSEHLLAQKLGRAKWYESYTVQVAEIKREYGFPGPAHPSR